MKKAICLSLILMLFTGALAGCAGSTASTADSAPAATDAPLTTEAPAASAPEAAHEFDFDGSIVRVSVDLSDGWAVEFGEMATYLYNCPVDDAQDAVAYGVYMDQEEYDEYLAQLQNTDTFVQGENGAFTYKAEDTHYYVSKIADGTYFEIMVNAADDSEEISKRFDVKYVSESYGSAYAAQAEHSVQAGGCIIDVRADLYRGWSASFGENVAYLYNTSLDEGEAVAWATFMEQEEYDAFLEDNSEKDTFVQNGDLIEYTDEVDMTQYISSVKEGLYFCVTVNGAEDPAAVRDCFSYSMAMDLADEAENASEAEEETASEEAPVSEEASSDAEGASEEDTTEETAAD